MNSWKDSKGLYEIKKGEKMITEEILAHRKKVFEHFFGILLQHVKVDGSETVAEYGVGRAGFGRFYAEKFNKVYGIDLEDYSEFHPGVEFALSNGIVTPIADNTLDMVFSHSVLEHVEDLDSVLSDMNRMLKVGGHLYLTVNPLYFSSYGAHLSKGGKHVENWEHLDPEYEHYLTNNPMPEAQTKGHFLNKMTSSDFLAAIGYQPWDIISYQVIFENKPIPEFVNKEVAKVFDMKLKGFRFVGQKKLVN